MHLSKAVLRVAVLGIIQVNFANHPGIIKRTTDRVNSDDSLIHGGPPRLH